MKKKFVCTLPMLIKNNYNNNHNSQINFGHRLSPRFTKKLLSACINASSDFVDNISKRGSDNVILDCDRKYVSLIFKPFKNKRFIIATNDKFIKNSNNLDFISSAENDCVSALLRSSTLKGRLIYDSKILKSIMPEHSKTVDKFLSDDGILAINRDRVPSKPVITNPFIYFADILSLFKKKKLKMEKVTDYVYRSSDINPKQFGELHNKGIRTILNLKSIGLFRRMDLTVAADNYGIKYVNIPMNIFKKDTNSIFYIMRALETASEDNKILIHCSFGKDRTGIASAIAKKINKKTPIEEIVQDMDNHGYNNFLFKNMKSLLLKILNDKN